jgi:ABC-2 type transport system ATP-binding protein
VLFLDEPTTGLDPTSRLSLWDEVRNLNADGTTVFLTTQYLEEADELAARIAIIDQGHIVREGRPSDLKAAVGAPTLKVEVPSEQEPTAKDVLSRFGSERVARQGVLAIGLDEGAPEMAAVVRAFDEAGVVLNHIELDAPTLDDVFADATGYRLEGASASDAGDGEAAPV